MLGGLVESFGDRWLSSPSKVKRGSGSSRKEDTFSASDGTEIRSVSDQRGDRLPRKATLCELDEDSTPKAPPNWIPYVHFDV